MSVCAHDRFFEAHKEHTKRTQRAHKETLLNRSKD